MATLRKINLMFFGTFMLASIAGVTNEWLEVGCPGESIAAEIAFYAIAFTMIWGLVDMCIRKAN